MHHRSVKQQPTRSMRLQSCGSMPRKQPGKAEGKIYYLKWNEMEIYWNGSTIIKIHS